MIRFAGATAFLMLALSPLPAAAQPKDVQPDCIAFGTVHAGDTVQGGFLVYEPGKNGGIGEGTA